MVLACAPQSTTVILGDSIAHGTCCSIVGPADYLKPATLLAALKARQHTRFVVVEIGPMNPYVATPTRVAMRGRLNARLRALNATNVTVLPFVASSLPDGLHPDDIGYAQQMPAVVDALTPLR